MIRRRHGNGRKRRGFALVVTISMMVLLALLAVAMLGLSGITLRNSRHGEAMATARANARMALNLAIGELQRTMGPDRAISARASAVSPGSAEPNRLGVWESWRWQPGSGSPDYTGKRDRFLRWLASDSDVDGSHEPESDTLSDPVVLAGGTLSASGDDRPELRGGRVAVQEDETVTGGFAWAVMDESLKAPIHLDEREEGGDAEQLAERVAPSRARPEAVIPELSPEVLGSPERILSLDTAVLASGGDRERILAKHQALTPHSLGLLTNVVDGGMKTDLTTMFEPSSARLDEINGSATVYGSEDSGAPRWDYLRSHYQLNRRVVASSSGRPKVELNRTELRPGVEGFDTAPRIERLLPVVLKLQIMFSMVTHHSHIPERVDFYNRFGDPMGNENYATPHLVYDPVLTLYNPYDVALELPQLRVRIWDPPVVFGFRKNNEWLRPEFGQGEFQGLARLRIANEGNPNARHYFSLFLREMGAGAPGDSIRLEPGEVKLFSPWVEPQWNWGLETAGGLTMRCFFDFDASRDFGNRDGRSGNQMGIEAVPGWDPRAGLQVDHLSYTRRPLATRYEFEKRIQPGYPSGMDGGWVAIKTDDEVTVEALPGRTVAAPTEPDFAIDLLAGTVSDPSRDMLRSYRFRMRDVEQEITTSPANPLIRRKFRVGDLLQKPTDDTPGGKTPFAIFSMTAKTTRDSYDVSKPWLFNHPVVEGSEQSTARIGNALDTYDLRLEEATGFNSWPGGIEFDPQTNRGYFGSTSHATGGVSQVPMFRVPLLPAASLGDLIPANLVASSHLPRVTHAFGNARAHPLIPSDSVSADAPVDSAGETIDQGYEMLDHSYLMNDALWDHTFFSSVAEFSGNELVVPVDRGGLLEEFLAGRRELLNTRFVPLVAGRGRTDQLAERLDEMADDELSRAIGSVLAVEGPFNVNSDSVDAWRALLASLRDSGLQGWEQRELGPDGKTAFSRSGLPLAGDADSAETGMVDQEDQVHWAGFRALDDEEVERLAEEIVRQIRLRGERDLAPSLSLGEFVNRRPGRVDALHALAGLLQTAIDESGVNDDYHALHSKQLGDEAAAGGAAYTGIATPEALAGESGEGAPPILTQGDLLMALAPVITVRGDTFRIRAYGESRSGSGEIDARAWCEAVVQRVPEYLDPTEEPELSFDELGREVNRNFGRRIRVVSFRWLGQEEV